MKMKKIHICLLAVLGISLVSCEDFLTQYPGNKITPDDFFKNEREINLYANSFYQRDMPATSVALGDGITDILPVVTIPNYLKSSYSAADKGGWSWSILRNINFFIEKVQNSPVEEKVKSRFIGEARFWRARFYFEKVLDFGGVPWYDHVVKVEDREDLYKKRDSREDVMNHVLEDLDAAVQHCVPQKDNSCTFVTKYVALALKTRICLFEGTFRKYHQKDMPELGDPEKWLREAAKAAKAIMDSGEYKLHATGHPESDYRALFTAENIAGVNSIKDEVIWAQVYETELRRWHDLTWKYDSGTYGSRWSLNRAFVNTYLMTDGSRFSDKEKFNEILFKDEVKNRDLRLQQTIRTPGYVRSDGSKALPKFTTTLTGYQVLKWSLDNKKYDSKNEATNAIPIFRYAEILLSYAEAKAELGEFSTIEWNQTIRLLRERAGVNGKEPETADNYLRETFYPEITDKYLLEIRRERAIELVAEDQRYNDLMRWKRGENLSEEVLPWTGIYVPELGKGQDLDNDGKIDIIFYRDQKPSVTGIQLVQLNDHFTLTEGDKGNIVWAKGLERKWEDYKYLSPIPHSVVELNQNIQQNPGWENK